MPDLPVLDPVEQRVLGSLLEKQVAVPASYPLTLSALRTACNQTSSRDPITDYDEALRHETVRRLRDRELLRVVWAGAGQRVVKHHQLLTDTLGVDDAERALLTVLLLRGPQAPGELKTRCARLHEFADRSEVEQHLQQLAERPEPLVRQLDRRAGQQDHRWTHLLGAAEPEAVPADVDLEVALAAGPGSRDERVIAAYDAVAPAYADALAGELDGLPFERWLLGRVAERGGPVVEVGCGPGHITAFLAASGVVAEGVDISPGMIAEARRRFPGGTYRVGDLRQLMRPAAAHGWSAVLAWYSLIHLAPSEWPAALAALARPLAPGGLLVVAAHAGNEVRHVAEWFGSAVDLDTVLLDPAGIRAAVAEAGLQTVEWYHRGPLADRGETTERVYLLATPSD